MQAATTKNIWGELLFELVTAPVWWYTKGAKRAALRCFKRLHDEAAYLGVWVWLRNLFTPMYGQYDMTGRSISFVIRLLQLLVRGTAFLLSVLINVGLFFLYLAWPVLITLEIAYQWLGYPLPL